MNVAHVPTVAHMQTYHSNLRRSLTSNSITVAAGLQVLVLVVLTRLALDTSSTDSKATTVVESVEI